MRGAIVLALFAGCRGEEVVSADPDASIEDGSSHADTTLAEVLFDSEPDGVADVELDTVPDIRLDSEPDVLDSAVALDSEPKTLDSEPETLDTSPSDAPVADVTVDVLAEDVADTAASESGDADSSVSDAAADAPSIGPRSCAVSGDGRSNCGATAESCCTSILVSGGTFSRSYDGATTGYLNSTYKATLGDYRLDKFEVTVGRFRKFVDAVVGGWTPTAGSGKHAHLGGLNGGTEPGWDSAWSSELPTAKSTWDTAVLACSPGYQTWTPSPGAHETRPVTCINWYQAAAFCIWDDGFLPSEAEWNYAAAGGAEQRVYPWGPTAPAANADLAAYNCYFSGTSACDGVSDIAPVGSIAAGNGKFGHADLAGNVWEWVLDWHKTPYNETACNNCSYVVPSTHRVTRGGSFINAASFQLSSYRNLYVPAYRSNNVGLRCARAP